MARIRCKSKCLFADFAESREISDFLKFSRKFFLVVKIVKGKERVEDLARRVAVFFKNGVKLFFFF